MKTVDGQILNAFEAPKGILIVSSHGLYAVKNRNVEIVQNFATNNIVYCPDSIVKSNILLMTKSGSVYSFDNFDLSLNWSKEIPKQNVLAFAENNEMLYFICFNDPNLYAHDFKNDKLDIKFTFDNSILCF